MDQDILRWLDEDIPYWDVSYIESDHKDVRGSIIAKDEGIIAGVTVVRRILDLLEIEIIEIIEEGSSISNKQEVIKFKGKATNVLKAERLMLNILSHMSGIATKTSKLTKIFENKNRKTKIAATRKTLPGLRKYQKWAVMIGGGDTHRLDLSAMALIKENHIATYGGVKNAITEIKDKISFSHKIEIEVRNDVEAIEAAETGVEIIMLDNYSPEAATNIIPKIREIDSKILIEVSGGITEDNISKFQNCDVDIISLGSLTHSVNAFDFSLLLDEAQ